MDLIGSDGRVYRFLAKPKDDLRKDNRMMEVASILNGLFAKDPASRRRNLLIRRSASLPRLQPCNLIMRRTSDTLYAKLVRMCLPAVSGQGSLAHGGKTADCTV